MPGMGPDAITVPTCPFGRSVHPGGMIRSCSPSLPLLAFGVLIFILVPSPAGAADPSRSAWTDPAKAAAEDADFVVQGEYTGKGGGAASGRSWSGAVLCEQVSGRLAGGRVGPVGSRGLHGGHRRGEGGPPRGSRDRIGSALPWARNPRKERMCWWAKESMKS